MNAPPFSLFLLVYPLGLYMLHRASDRALDSSGSTQNQPLPWVGKDGIWLVPLGERGKNAVFCS